MEDDNGNMHTDNGELSVFTIQDITILKLKYFILRTNKQCGH